MIFEKIRERLHELYDINDKFKKEAYEEQDWERFDINLYRNEGVYRAIDIINQVESEYTCENCAEKGKCSIYDNANIKYCSDCRPVLHNHTDKPITNADRIRQMTDEELAEFLVNFKNTFGEEYEGVISCLEWLRKEVEEKDE